MMKSAPHLERWKKPLWETIRDSLPAKKPLLHYSMVKEYPYRQGKYFRPLLLLLSVELFGGKIAEALPLAASLQMAQDWLLVHDDVEDRSLLRRNRPTLNALYGNELAVNAGDALHLLMWKSAIAATSCVPREIGKKITEYLSSMLLTVTEGQFLELQWVRQRKFRVSYAEYFDMVRRKTASYTTTGPVRLGMLFAGFDSAAGSLERWTTPLGIAFQIRDDIADVETDSVEGKRTLIFIHMLEHCTAKQRREVINLYSKNELLNPEEKKFILQLIQKYGSVEYASRVLEKFQKEAQVAFSKGSRSLPQNPANECMRKMISSSPGVEVEARAKTNVL